MRTINQIQSEIAKLEAEMADVKEVDSAQKEAVYILRNLGWTRENGLWVKPKPKTKHISAVVGSKVSDHNVIVGDKVERRGYFGSWYVRQLVAGQKAIISEINYMSQLDQYTISNRQVTVFLSELKRI